TYRDFRPGRSVAADGAVVAQRAGVVGAVQIGVVVEEKETVVDQRGTVGQGQRGLAVGRRREDSSLARRVDKLEAVQRGKTAAESRAAGSRQAAVAVHPLQRGPGEGRARAKPALHSEVG